MSLALRPRLPRPRPQPVLTTGPGSPASFCATAALRLPAIPPPRRQIAQISGRRSARQTRLRCTTSSQAARVVGTAFVLQLDAGGSRAPRDRARTLGPGPGVRRAESESGPTRTPSRSLTRSRPAPGPGPGPRRTCQCRSAASDSETRAAKKKGRGRGHHDSRLESPGPAARPGAAGGQAKAAA